MPLAVDAVGVRVHLTAGSRSGQGVALSRGTDCSVITAFHVVGDGAWVANPIEDYGFRYTSRVPTEAETRSTRTRRFCFQV